MVYPHLTSSTKVTVTGGAGFIGSHLVETLLDSGVGSVQVIDNLSTSNRSSIPVDQRVTIAHADLSDLSEASLRELLRSTDILFHLAAEKHQSSIDRPERVLDVNVRGSLRLFRAAAAEGVGKTVFTSSLYATGRLTLPAMREDEAPSPATIYGISKLTGEHVLRYVASNSDLRWTTLRLFFVYGPRQYVGGGYKSVIVTNFERILSGKSPMINGDGQQALDYTFVEDTVDAIIRASSSLADGRVLNVGSGAATSVNALTDRMLEVAGSDLSPEHADADWTAGTVRVADPALIHEILGWKASTPLHAGLKRTYEWLARSSSARPPRGDDIQ